MRTNIVALLQKVQEVSQAALSLQLDHLVSWGWGVVLGISCSLLTEFCPLTGICGFSPGCTAILTRRA